MHNSDTQRAFKTEWFAKAARKAKLSDASLCKAIVQAIAGQCDDLGGGVFKKRLSNNQLRSIILARGESFWVYQFLFAKQDRANIDDSELDQFRALAKIYAGMTLPQVEVQITNGLWVEICQHELEQKQ